MANMSDRRAALGRRTSTSHVRPSTRFRSYTDVTDMYGLGLRAFQATDNQFIRWPTFGSEAPETPRSRLSQVSVVQKVSNEDRLLLKYGGVLEPSYEPPLPIDKHFNAHTRRVFAPNMAMLPHEVETEVPPHDVLDELPRHPRRNLGDRNAPFLRLRPGGVLERQMANLRARLGRKKPMLSGFHENANVQVAPETPAHVATYVTGDDMFPNIAGVPVVHTQRASHSKTSLDVAVPIAEAQQQAWDCRKRGLSAAMPVRKPVGSGTRVSYSMDFVHVATDSDVSSSQAQARKPALARTADHHLPTNHTEPADDDHRSTYEGVDMTLDQTALLKSGYRGMLLPAIPNHRVGDEQRLIKHDEQPVANTALSYSLPEFAADTFGNAFEHDDFDDQDDQDDQECRSKGLNPSTIWQIAVEMGMLAVAADAEDDYGYRASVFAEAGSWTEK